MAEVINNYPSLVSAVVNVAEDQSDEFRDFIPTAIGLAEDRMVRELDSQLLIANTTVSISDGSKYIEKPSGFRLGHEVLLKTSSGDRKLLKKRQKSFCEVYWPFQASTAEPVYYADVDVSTIMLAPTPEDDSYIVYRYEAPPVKLSEDVSVNALTTFYPNSLFYATMSEMATFEKAWSQVQFWDSKYMESIQGANNEGRRARRDSTESPSNPSKVVNDFSQGGE